MTNEMREYIRDVLVGELQIPATPLFRDKYFEFRDGKVIAMPSWTELLNKLREEWPLIELSIYKVFMARGASSNTRYPEIVVEFKLVYSHNNDIQTFDNKDCYAKYHFGSARDITYGGFRDEDFVLALYRDEFFDKVYGWCRKNDYLDNIRRSKVVRNYLEEGDMRDKDGRMRFNWIAWLCNKIKKGSYTLRGSNLFECTSEVLAISNDKLVEYFLYTQTANLHLPEALSRYYFPEIKVVRMANDNKEEYIYELFKYLGNPYNEKTFAYNSGNRLQAHENHEFDFYIAFNLMDVIDGQFIWKEDKYKILTEAYETKFKEIIKDNINNWQLVYCNVSLGDNYDEEKTIGIMFTLPGIEGSKIFYSDSIASSGYDSTSTSSTKYRRIGVATPSFTYIVSLAKRLGVFNELIEGLRKVLPKQIAVNIATEIFKNKHKHVEALSMNHYPIRHLISHIYKTEEAE